MWPFGKSAKDRLVDAMHEQDLTKVLDLDVSVSNKTAKMSGSIPNERYKNLITAIANGINGINDVDLSGLVVAADSGGLGTDSSEQLKMPSGRAKAALERIRQERSLADNPIDVLQSGNIIVLRGAVDSETELAKAKELAASVEGVTGVDASGLQVIAHASDLNVTDEDGDIVYTVKSGDTLSHIALNYYGSAGAKSYMKIAEANGISDPNKIRVGQKLKIPGTVAGPESVLG